MVETRVAVVKELSEIRKELNGKGDQQTTEESIQSSLDANKEEKKEE